MSTKEPIKVQSTVLAHRNDDGVMILQISSKVGEFEFEFAPEAWDKLSESAGWHGKRTNGVTKNDEEITKP